MTAGAPTHKVSTMFKAPNWHVWQVSSSAVINGSFDNLKWVLSFHQRCLSWARDKMPQTDNPTNKQMDMAAVCSLHKSQFPVFLMMTFVCVCAFICKSVSNIMEKYINRFWSLPACLSACLSVYLPYYGKHIGFWNFKDSLEIIQGTIAKTHHLFSGLFINFCEWECVFINNINEQGKSEGFDSCDRMTLKNNRAPLLSNIKL